ncbi:MAG TPA: MFS transporter, partial [Sphingomicrobium sp.]|nr:MFS transporter [Sphingomicrobium sp.]
VLTLATAAAAVPSGWLADRIGRPAVMLAGGAIGAVGVAALPLAGSLPAILVFGSLMAVGSAAFGAGSWAALADATAERSTGRLLGIANLGTAGAAAAAGLFGPLIDAAGFGPAFALAGVLAAAGALVGWRAGASAPRPSLRPIEVFD